jgi:endogenous inhibitor of DNA gyrase (YacG/DUF329 family)
VSSPRCPVCNKEVAPRAANRAFPFCSPRCKQVDLGKWLGEEYRLPERAVEEREDERPPDPERGPFDA